MILRCGKWQSRSKIVRRRIDDFTRFYPLMISSEPKENSGNTGVRLRNRSIYYGGDMTSQKSRLDPAFLERQKRRLTEVRKQILQVRRGQAGEEAGVNADASGQAREFEDDAQKLTTLELEGNLEAADDNRLSNIERALQKIVDGTYGLSDASGAPISIERLEASPESLYTLDEQKSRDPAR
jgi:DnaK suppressor protein